MVIEKSIDNSNRKDWSFLESSARNEKVLKEVQKFHYSTMNTTWKSIRNNPPNYYLFRWLDSVVFKDILPKSYEENIQLNVKKHEMNNSTHYFKKDATINLQFVGQLLYDAFGRDEETGSKKYPSAGALYPIVPLLLVFDEKAINGINVPGCYVFDSTNINLLRVSSWETEDQIQKVTKLVSFDSEIRSPYCIAYAIDYKRAVTKYLYKGYRHALIEVGLMAQSFREVLKLDGILGERCWSGFEDLALTAACGLNVRLCPITLIQWFGYPENNFQGEYNE